MKGDDVRLREWLQEAAGDRPELYVDVLKFARTEVFQEWAQLTSRFGSMVSSQSFLLISFCASINASAVVHSALKSVGTGLGVVGIVNCATAWVAMRMAQNTIAEWHRKKSDCLFEVDANGSRTMRPTVRAYAIERDINESNRPNVLSLFYVNVTPPAFIVLWVWLLIWVWFK